MEPRIVVKDVHKEFVLHDNSGSIKAKLLWWRKKHRRVRVREVREVLKGVSFEVMPGEAVAVIGRNGAGKSTLLSILARVLLPTSGHAKVDGRVAPLLELGAGFHPDLSGRENIVVNGMLLGLTRKQVTQRMNQIIAFSEIEDYIDAPVRTYSSGMASRLGFSVAAHVDADVMIVDESLAAGDFRFVEKCEQYLAEFRSRGGTILFVSHSFDIVEQVAERAIWLDRGEIRADGPTEEVVVLYRASSDPIHA